MVTVPKLTPAAIPVLLPMVAIAVLLLLQVPPAVVSVNRVEELTQTLLAPEMAPVEAKENMGREIADSKDKRYFMSYKLTIDSQITKKAIIGFITINQKHLSFFSTAVHTESS